MFKLIQNVYFSKLMLEVWLIGLLSGLTLLVSSSTLNFWLAKNDINIINIGLFSIISLPYAINFLWAPIIDSIELPFLSSVLNQRKSWILLLGILLSSAIWCLGFLNPKYNLRFIAIIGFLVSFFSSTLDIALGGLRTEILNEKSYGPASGIYLFGYRIGMVISKTGAIYLSFYINWSIIYKALATLVFVLIVIIIYFAPARKTSFEKPISKLKQSPKDFFYMIIDPIGSFKFIIILLCFLILYKLPDNILNSMISPFLLQIGFNEIEISTLGYLLGSIFSIVGGGLAGLITERLGIYKSLYYFGGLHAAAHLLFILLAYFSKQTYLLPIVISIEGFTGGMAMSSYITLIISLCKGKYRGTQYSLFSAMMGISRSIIPSISGFLVLQAGWINFFLSIFILSLPSLCILKKYFLKRETS